MDSRVAAVAVGDEFEEEGATLVFHGPLARESDGLGASDDVHAVNLQAGNLIAAGEVGGVGRAPLSRSAHSVFVVFADKDRREIPQLGLQSWLASISRNDIW